MSPALQADSLPAERELSLNGHGDGAWKQRGKGTQEGAGRGQGVSAHTCACVCLPQSVNSTTQFPFLGALFGLHRGVQERGAQNEASEQGQGQTEGGP